MPHETTSESTIPCETCCNDDGGFCSHIKHGIENGYAMVCHSRSCGGYKKRGDSSEKAKT